MARMKATDRFVAESPQATSTGTEPRSAKHIVLPRRLGSLAAGWLLCEILLRSLVPSPIFYSTWFTKGIHRTDKSLGFIFQPNYEGAMRHADGVWMEPLSLDANGFRLPATNHSTDDRSDIKRVVMLGGASMAFCFGLSDPESLHHRVAQAVDRPMIIEVVSWPGFTLEQDFMKVERFLDVTEIDCAVVFAYAERDYKNVLQLDEPLNELEFVMDQDVVLPTDPSARLGPLYYRSYVMAGAARWWTTLSQIAGFDGRGSIKTSRAPEPSNFSAGVGDPAAIKAARRLQQNGVTRVLVVALPHQLKTLGPKSLAEFEGDDLAVLDLRKMSQLRDMDWLAGGHYGPRSSQAIAARIAKKLSSDSTD